MQGVERIVSKGLLLALVVRTEADVAETTFLTEDRLNMQVGLIKYPSGSEIPRHFHHPIHREIVGTSEAIVVRRGRCELDVFDDDKQLVATRRLGPGDLVMLFAGGHGFRVLEDTTLLEIKQGPYPGLEEKERF